jgi:catechol 2,3-dioxygenase-like lactoylglutathione lyase family enzyme
MVGGVIRASGTFLNRETVTSASTGPESIDEAVEHLGRHGLEIVAGPLESDSGARGRGRHVYFRDPDGSLLEFVSYR